MIETILSLGKILSKTERNRIKGKQLPAPTEYNYCCIGSSYEWLEMYPHLSRYSCFNIICTNNPHSDNNAH